jgi:hypothetical protein
VSGAVFVCFGPSVCVSFVMLYSGVISNRVGINDIVIVAPANSG